MSNKDILNSLADIEQELFYRYTGGADREGISFADTEQLHNAARALLNQFFHLCTLAEGGE